MNKMELGPRPEERSANRFLVAQRVSESDWEKMGVQDGHLGKISGMSIRKEQPGWFGRLWEKVFHTHARQEESEEVVRNKGLQVKVAQDARVLWQELNGAINEKLTRGEPPTLQEMQELFNLRVNLETYTAWLHHTQGLSSDSLGTILGEVKSLYGNIEASKVFTNIQSQSHLLLNHDKMPMSRENLEQIRELIQQLPDTIDKMQAGERNGTLHTAHAQKMVRELRTTLQQLQENEKIVALVVDLQSKYQAAITDATSVIDLNEKLELLKEEVRGKIPPPEDTNVTARQIKTELVHLLHSIQKIKQVCEEEIRLDDLYEDTKAQEIMKQLWQTKGVEKEEKDVYEFFVVDRHKEIEGWKRGINVLLNSLNLQLQQRSIDGLTHNRLIELIVVQRAMQRAQELETVLKFGTFSGANGSKQCANILNIVKDWIAYLEGLKQSNKATLDFINIPLAAFTKLQTQMIDQQYAFEVEEEKILATVRESISALTRKLDNYPVNSSYEEKVKWVNDLSSKFNQLSKLVVATQLSQHVETDLENLEKKINDANTRCQEERTREINEMQRNIDSFLAEHANFPLDKLLTVEERQKIIDQARQDYANFLNTMTGASSFRDLPEWKKEKMDILESDLNVKLLQFQRAQKALEKKQASS